MTIKDWAEYDFEEYKDPQMIRAVCDAEPPIVFAVCGTPCSPPLIQRYGNSEVQAEDTYELVGRIQECLKACKGLTVDELKAMNSAATDSYAEFLMSLGFSEEETQDTERIADCYKDKEALDWDEISQDAVAMVRFIKRLAHTCDMQRAFINEKASKDDETALTWVPDHGT